MNNIAKLDSFVIDIVSNNICVLLFKVHSITHQKIRIKNTFCFKRRDRTLYFTNYINSLNIS